jgi:putative SOS response-associated peptidase YedK
MPAPLLPPKKPGEPPKPGRPVTNVRNVRSGHWRPWLASSSVVVGKEQHKGGRCIVPASAFAEPDRNTANPVVFRWFQRSDGLPFFFAGIWREWQGVRGTKKAPNVGLHRLYAFLTTEPNGVVEPIHNKAMPVMLLTREDVERRLAGTLEEALELQKPAHDAAVAIRKEQVAA